MMPNFLKTILIIVLTLSILSVFSVASAAINKQFNYQGKLTDDAGVAVADVAHNIKFVIYDAASGGNCLWTARGSCGSETARSITPSSGLFSVMLGDTVAGDNAIGLNFNTDSYYLGITVESDAEMTPRKRIGAVPQAFNALNLIGSGYIDIDNTSITQDALNINYNPASGAYDAASITYGSGGGTGIALTVTQSGNGNIVDFKNSSISIFTVASGGLAIFAGVPAGTGVAQGSLYVNPATATADYTLLGLAVGGAEKFRVDEDGDVVIEGDVSFTGSQTISTTAGDLVLNPTGNLALSSNSITGLGTGITASGALTISTTGANNLTLTPGTGLTTTGSTFQITGGFLDVDTYAGIAYSGATTALTVTQSGTGAIADFTNTASATSGAFTLTNLGSGNSFLVEDSASADSTPFVIDASGQVGIGTTTPLATLDVRGTIENGLVAWWSMDEGTGETTIIDQSINSNTGTLGGGDAAKRPSWTNGKFGKALDFDGDDDFVDCGSASSVQLTGNSFSIEIWLRINQAVETDKYEYPISTYNGGSTGYILVLQPTDMSFYINGNDLSLVGPLPVGQWNQVMLVYDGTNRYGYVNTTLKNSGAWSTNITSGGNLFLGKRYDDDASTYFNGQIDQVKIYNRALSAREISESYRQKAPSMAQGGTVSDNSAYTALTVQQSSTGNIVDLQGTGLTSGKAISLTNSETAYTGTAVELDIAQDQVDYAYNFDGGSTYTDNTTEANSNAGTAYTLLADTNDYFYFGDASTFDTLNFDIATAATSATLVWEYCSTIDGSSDCTAWTTVTPTDGTTGFTIDGKVYWTDPGALWLTGNVNSISSKWLRVHASALVGTPTAYYSTISMFTGNFAEMKNAGSTKFVIDSDGNMGIGTDTPLSTLDVRGTIENGLVAWWSMDEGTGETTITDQSINSNTGTLGGGTAGYRPSWTNGKFGKGLDFDGNDDYVEVADHASLNITNAITIEAWIYPDSLGEDDGGRIVDKSNTGYLLSMYPTNALRFYANNGAVNKYSDNNVITIGQWQHVVLTYDRINVSFYVNGVLKNAKAETDAIGVNSDSLSIGAKTDTTKAFNGQIDQVRIYNRALSSREISESYRQKASSMAQGGTISDNSAFTALTVQQSSTGNALTIDQNGNVGTTVSTDGALFVENTGNTGIGLNTYTNIDATADASLIYFTADNDAFDQEVLTVRQDGTGSIASFTNTADATSDALTINNLGTGNAISIDQDGNVGTAVATDGALFIENTGNTGIGLNVYSNAASAAADAGLVYFTADESTFDQTVLTVDQDGTGDIVNIFDGDTEVFTILDGGNVGIGTASPSYILDVKGKSSIGAATITGGGLDDMTSGGTFIGATALDYIVRIDNSTASPDTFEWDDDGELTTNQEATGVAITFGSAQDLNNGVTITFAAGDGHTLNNYWEFSTTVTNPLAVQNAAGTRSLYIGNDGCVGIGTTSTSSATSLTVDQTGTGAIMDVKNSGTSAFEVNQAIVKISQPLQINVAGDVGFSRSIEFTSTGSSHIYSEGPFTIAAGDPNSAENLTLTTRTSEELAETGTVSAFSDADALEYIEDSSQSSWVNDEFVGGRIEITGNEGKGQIREICANTSSGAYKISVCTDWDTDPVAASSTYEVYRKAGDILVNISGTNMTSGGFKVSGIDTNAIFRISPEGDVGIGTMSPSANLDIKGILTVALTGTLAVDKDTAAVTGTNTLFNSELAVGDAIKILDEIFTVLTITNDTTLTLDSNYLGSNISGITAHKDSNLFYVQDGDGTGKLVIDKSGNVGIGTTAPDKILEINGASGGNIRLAYNDSDGSAADYVDFQVGSDGDLTITTVDSNGTAGDIILAPDGNVGIGVSAPNTKLDVQGGQTWNVTTVNAATYDVVVTDHILNVTYTPTAAVTSLTLPTAQAVEGRVLIINDAGGNATNNNITIDTEGAETINGAATYVISVNHDSASLYSDGTNWFNH